jgi:hypothetical protein
MADNETNQLTLADEVEACDKFAKHLLATLPMIYLHVQWHLKAETLTELAADLRHRFEHGEGLHSEEEERAQSNGCTLLEETILIADHVKKLYEEAIELPPAVNQYLRDVRMLMQSASIELHSMIFTGKPTSRYVRPYAPSDSPWAYPPEAYDAVPLTSAPPIYSGREKYLSAFPDYPEGQDYFRGFDCGEKSVIQRQRLEMRFRKKEVLSRLERELSGFSKATKESDLYGFLGQLSGLVEGGLLDRAKAEELNHLAKMQVLEWGRT